MHSALSVFAFLFFPPLLFGGFRRRVFFVARASAAAGTFGWVSAGVSRVVGGGVSEAVARVCVLPPRPALGGVRGAVIGGA